MATYISIETDKKISYQIDGGDKQTMFANIDDDGYPEPEGTITITENGTGIDVKDYAAADVAVPTYPEPTGTITITENAFDIDVKDYAAADVLVEGGGYPEPTGTITITQNGTGIDVKDYAAADVAVPTYPEPTGTKQISITQNGTTTENVKDYASAEVTVNVASYPEPTGTKQISITQNGTTTENVKDYASAEITVNVAGSSFDADGFNAGTYPTGTLNLQTSTAITIEGRFRDLTGITAVNAPLLETADAHSVFRNCTNIETVNAPLLTSVGNYFLSMCKHIAVLHLSKLQSTGISAFDNVGSLTENGCIFVLPSITSVGNDTFRGVKNTSKIDIGPGLNLLSDRCIYNFNMTGDLILRSSTMVACNNLNSISALSQNLSAATVYVPQSLIATYEADSIWSTILSKSSFAAIEGSQYETHYADGTLIPTT